MEPDIAVITVDGSQTPKLNGIQSGKDPKRNYWKREEEEILKDWADKAQCYEWMHLRSHMKYRKMNAWFTIPVIVISTITGTANFAQDRFGEDYKSWVVMGIGAFNILAGIITTIYQFLKISELNECHRVAALYWGKFYRNLRTELSKHPLDRANHDDIVNSAKEEYDRLLELSPMIPQNIIREFNNKYSAITGFTRPEIVTTQFGTNIFRMTDDDRRKMVDELLEDKIAIEKSRIHEVEQLRETNDMLSNKLDSVTQQLLAIETKQSHEANTHILTNTICLNPEESEKNKFNDTFFKINGRYPNDIEINHMLKYIISSSPDTSPGKDSSTIDLSDYNHLDTTMPDYSEGSSNV